ncbi:MAG: hypothetical protein ACJASM_003032 [Salibacteraceae bacterium]|jgi:hypothetical protein
MKFLISILLLPTCLFSQKLDTLDFGKGYFIIGAVVNDEINGEGCQFMKWEKIYEGEFRNTEYHGYGKYFLDGRLYLEGKWENGKFKEGTRHISNGRIDSGAFDDYEMVSGSISYPDGDRYEGSVKKGRRHGLGTIFLIDGTQIETTWKKGRPVGTGILLYPDGTSINGTWNRNKLNETHFMVLINGSEQIAKNTKGELIFMTR